MVVRAGVMGGLFVTAIYLGRRATAHVSLFASAVVLTMINPLALWDVGFQLSFAATLSLILFVPVLERFLERALQRVVPPERAQQTVRLLSDVLVVTLAAQLLTLPLVVFHFGRLSTVAPIANLLILPVQMPVMVLGGTATLTGLVPIVEPVARIIAWVPWLCLDYTNAVVRWMASWPFASLEVSRAGAGWFLFLYGAILGSAWLMSRRRTDLPGVWTWMATRGSTKLILGLALAAAILAWLAVIQLPDGRLHVAFLDVGQGDAILITTPQGQQILVDGGPSPSALTSALGNEMPFWDRSLDLVVMTHADADHITGLTEVLKRYRVDGWLDNGQSNRDAIYVRCRELLEETGVSRSVVQSGNSLSLGQGAVLEVLHPPREPTSSPRTNANNSSIVLRLVWGDASFLLTGDIEAEAEQLLLRSGQPLAADALKVSHHGSSGSSTAEFLAAVDPHLAVISVGADNRFGHPTVAVLDRLTSLGDVSILRTDESGTVELITDGQRLWIRTER